MMLVEKIIIALPTLNEEGAIEKLVERIRGCTDLPIIIIDGYSTDRTVSIAKQLNLTVYDRKEYGKGYGGGIKKAIEVASSQGFEWLMIMDCDLTYFPEDLSKFMGLQANNDLVVGVRPYEKISFSHRVANRIHNLFAQLIYAHPVNDINSGFRMLRVSLFNNRLTETNMGMVAQISSIAMRNRWRISEIPINYGKRVGKSKIDILDGFVILWCILRERLTKRVG